MDRFWSLCDDGTLLLFCRGGGPRAAPWVWTYGTQGFLRDECRRDDVGGVKEAFRRAVLRLFVRRELMDVETAHDMLAWPHSGFHVHDGVWVAADDREFAVRLARYCARNPVALSRLEYWSDDATLTYHSDKPTGPTAGSETVDVLEFLARVASRSASSHHRAASHNVGTAVCPRRD